MNFEVLKKSHVKRNIMIGIGVVFILSAVVLTFTRAKYRVTESVPLVSGTINFSPYDFNVVAMYLNKGDETVSTNKAPHVGYTLNSEQSSCMVDGAEVENGNILFENGNLTFQNMNYSGTKCSVYFDLIPDSENPIINNITTVSDETSITVTVDASDNIGVFYYYFQLDNGEEVRSEENTYTFENLNERQEYTVNVRVEDAVGNEDIDNKDVIVGYRTADVILASANPPTGQTTDWTGGISYYYTGNPNNWVEFAGFWWRIIRINGDGTIRMIYQGTSTNTTGSGTRIGTSSFNSSYNNNNNNMYVGYMYTNGERQGIGTSSIIKGVLDNWYSETSNLVAYADYIDGNAGFCGDRRVTSGTGIGTTETTYQSDTRIHRNSPSLTCEPLDIYTTEESDTGNKALTYPFGLISADEAAFAGLTWNSSDTANYLITEQVYWTMSPSAVGSSSGAVFSIMGDGSIYYDYGVASVNGVRPVINLRANVEITGSGTTSAPFRVVGAS